MNNVGKKEAVYTYVKPTQSECETIRSTKVGNWDYVSPCVRVTPVDYRCYEYYSYVVLESGLSPTINDGYGYMFCDSGAPGSGDCDVHWYISGGDSSEAYYKCIITGEWGCDGTNNGRDIFDEDPCWEYNCFYKPSGTVCPTGTCDGVGNCVGGSCDTDADTNCDGCVAFTELMTYANNWVAKLGPTFTDVMNVANRWILRNKGVC